MGVFIDIREKFGFILVGVIALAIISFLLMDGLNSNSSLVNSSVDNTVGTVAGIPVEGVMYNNKVKFVNQAYAAQNQQAPDDVTSHSLNNEAWNKLVLDLLLEPEYGKLGITVTKEELYNMFVGERPDRGVISSFTDPNTGQFNRDAVRNMLTNLDQYDEQTKNQFYMFERSIKENRYVSKYIDLVGKAIYYPEAIAKFDNNLKNTSVDFNYVYLPYTNITDAEVTVSDADIKDYVKQHAANYKQEPTRAIKFVVFEVLPVAEDTVAALDKITSNLEKFKTTKNDSSFVRMYSDRPNDFRYKSLAQLPFAFADTFFTVDTNTIIGPVLSEGAYMAIKLIDRKFIPDSVKLKHILLVPTKQEEVAGKRSLADSLAQLINDGSDFTELAIVFSEDEGTKFLGGDLDWVKLGGGSISERITEKAIYSHKEGDVFVIGTEQGFHVVQVVGSTPTTEAVQLAIFNREIVALAKTDKAVYEQASKFLTSHRSAEEFNTAEGDFSIFTADNIKVSDNTISRLGTSRELVAWAYNAEIGDVSSIKSVDNKYVIALLVSAIGKDEPDFEKIKGEVEGIVKKEKKAEMLAGKISQGQNLDALASAQGSTIQTANGMSQTNSYFDQVGLEPGLVNKALSLNKGDKAVVEGNNGVFYIELVNKTETPETANLAAVKTELASRLRSFAYSAVPQALIDAEDIEDRRYKLIRD